MLTMPFMDMELAAMFCDRGCIVFICAFICCCWQGPLPIGLKTMSDMELHENVFILCW